MAFPRLRICCLYPRCLRRSNRIYYKSLPLLLIFLSVVLIYLIFFDVFVWRPVEERWQWRKRVSGILSNEKVVLSTKEDLDYYVIGKHLHNYITNELNKLKTDTGSLNDVKADITAKDYYDFGKHFFDYIIHYTAHGKTEIKSGSQMNEVHSTVNEDKEYDELFELGQQLYDHITEQDEELEGSLENENKEATLNYSDIGNLNDNNVQEEEEEEEDNNGKGDENKADSY